jgi:ribosomal subunit interface protein
MTSFDSVQGLAATRKGSIMQIVVRGRHMEISDRFREHVSTKLSKVERYDGKCHRIDVEVSQESNPRLADRAVRVEITCHGKGPVIRAEAAADEKFAALDIAYGRLVERMRRAADRRHDHRRHQSKAHGDSGPEVVGALPDAASRDAEVDAEAPDEGPLVVRQKTHRGRPMTLDEALYEMELVGHDFFLFYDVQSGTPSVVYRRRGYDYGVLHLEVADEQAESSAS